MGWIENQIQVHRGFTHADYGADTWQASKLRALERGLAEVGRPIETLVDIGCFNGSLSGRLRRFAKRVVGIDVHLEALKEAEKKGIEVVYSDIGSGQPTPLPAACADAIVCADIIEHIIEPRHLMNEARRLLKPGGIMLLSTPNMGYWLSRVRLAMGYAPMCTNGVAPGFRSDRWVDPSHIHVSVLNEWAAFFQDCGWRVEKIRGSHLRFGGRRRTAAHLIDALCDRYLPKLSLIPVFTLTPVAAPHDASRASG
jgi:2-polyprenyl-3-methyl-5-hydroxy-6-metoxy-1,4-benzoquinol methylase